MKKVDIITLHRVVNYGSVLQTYALQEKIKEKGFEVETIDYYPERLHLFGMLKRLKNKKEILRKNPIVRFGAQCVIFPSYVQRFSMFKKFLKNYIKMTDKTYYNKEELEKDIPQADIYCTGSDQVWNSEWNEKIEYPFFLDFVPNDKKRISYAASFGKKSLVPEEVEETRRLVNKYQYLSMREISGVDILKQLGRNDGINVLDPTLLLNKKEWLKIASSKYNSKKYVLMYNLNRNKKIDKYVEKLAKERNLDIYYISYNLHECFKKGKMKCNVKVEDFLSLIANASYVVTDSFHATAFSINFNTPFMIIFPEKFSTRLASILEVTGLQDRIVEDYNDIKLADKAINFEHANKVLEDERKKASEYLDKALND